jgi:hypothetical protein
LDGALTSAGWLVDVVSGSSKTAGAQSNGCLLCA